MDKPQSSTEWVPLLFAVIAAYIVTLLVFAPTASEAAVQGSIAIATTLAGAAAGAYGQKMVSRLMGPPPGSASGSNPSQPAGPAA